MHPTGPTVAAHVRRLERAALDRLTAAAGPASLCALSRDGTPRPAAKYHEGAAVALAQACRALDEAAPEDDAATTLRAVRDRGRAPAGAGAAWAAYLDGGRDALDSLLESAPGDRADARPAPDARQDEAVGNRRRTIVL